MNAIGPGSLATALMPGAEDAGALASLVREAVAAGAQREVLYLRLGALGLGGLQRDQHLRLVREALTPVMRPSRARLFALPNGDLAAVAPPSGGHLAATAERVQMLLGSEAEAAGQDDPAGEPRPPVAMLLRLPRQALGLMVALEAAISPAEQPPEPQAAPAGEGRPLPGPSAADAALLERALGTLSIASYLRWQPVVRLAPLGDGPATCWTDWRLALPELWAALMAGRDPGAAPGLARRLRGVLDRRLLADLARPEEARRLGDAGFSMGLACLGSPEFRRFDEALGQPGRARVVLCLPAEEALGDPEGFLAARLVCARRGFRLALDVAEPAALPLLAPPDRLGVDYLRLRWSPGLPTAIAAPLPAGRVVLTGADRAAAVAWGWEAGITLFEGRMLRG